jgi:hypothetical protein
MFDPDKLKALQEHQERWQQTTLQSIPTNPERMDRFMTTSSAPVGGLYTPLDVADLDYERDLGFPGEYPTPAGCTPRCIVAGSGRCACSPALAPLRDQRPPDTCWNTGRLACRLP